MHLSELARLIAADLNKTQPERKVRLAIAPDLAVKGDARLLRLALENLLSNAYKFTGKQAEPKLEFGGNDGEGGTVFFVRDNGSGFDMAYANKLFGLFQRLYSADDFPGTGVGLAIVQRIIQRHGGRVWAEGEVGKGATFYFSV